MSLYLDATIIVPLVVVEPRSILLRTWLADQEDEFVIGRLTIAETGSAVSRLRRMDELNDTGAALALATLDEWINAAAIIVDHEPGDFIAAARFVRRPHPKLLSPDALHLATCGRLGHRLVTDDGDLLVAADLLGVGWVNPA